MLHPFVQEQEEERIEFLELALPLATNRLQFIVLIIGFPH
jgi:hypothetical protein